MGDAKRRKALGLYPDTSKPKDSSIEPDRFTRRQLTCARCGEPGGTFVDSPEGRVHADNDCDRAASLLKRLERRVRKAFGMSIPREEPKGE